MQSVLRFLPVVLVGSLILIVSEVFSAPRASSPSPYVSLEAMAHFVLYFGLGFVLCRWLVLGLKINGVIALMLAGCVSLSFGVADELHQLQIQGRSADFGDLLVDLGGGLGGAVLYLALARLLHWVRDVLSADPISWPRAVFRAAVTTVAAVAVCSLAMVHAEKVVRLGEALVSEGSVQARQVVDRYLTPHRAQINPLAHIPLPSVANEQARQDTRAPIQSGAPAPARFEQHVGTIQLTARAEPIPKAQKEATETLQNHNATSVEQPANGPERWLLEEMKRVLSQLDQSDRATMAAKASPTRDNAFVEGAGKIEGANEALRDRIGRALASSGIHLSKLPEKPASAVPAVRRLALGTGTNAPDPCDLIAIITDNTNPVSELTVDQVRKVFSGEYTNWSQAGGPDLPIKVITVRKQSGDLEKKIVDHIQAPLSKDAVRLPLVSLIIPVVAQTEGAVGFLPVLNTEQLDFVAEHKAFKRIAIKAGDQDPALAPSRIAVNTSMYPIMRDIPQHSPLAASSVAAREITR